MMANNDTRESKVRRKLTLQELRQLELEETYAFLGKVNASRAIRAEELERLDEEDTLAPTALLRGRKVA
jgi:hypothetical protein